jgi:hypothetical protein
MRRLDVDALFSGSIDPFSPVLSAWKYQRVNFIAVYDADFKVGVGWRVWNWQPLFGLRVSESHAACPRVSQLALMLEPSTGAFTTELINFVSQVKHASLEIDDHQVIGWVLEQSFGEFFFQRLLAPLQVRNMVWLWHDP